MMLGFPPSGRGTPQPLPGANAYTNPFAGLPGMNGTNSSSGPGADDPMLKLLQQMMGGLPSAGSSMLPATGPGMPAPEVAVASGDPYAYLWRIIHAVFAIGLGLYIALTAEFTGTKFAREMSGLGSAAAVGDRLAESSVRFFYIFATAETVLQTLRFALEEGTVQPGGILGMVMGFLPQPWKGYLALILRYGRIWTTTSTDALICVFVLGVWSWLRAA